MEEITVGEPLFVGVDYGSKDMTAICIAQQMKDASIKILQFAESFTAITNESVATMIYKILRKTARPKGYSQSHWRKIYRQSPRMQPYTITYDKSLSAGEQLK
jgi:hypothetical protein